MPPRFPRSIHGSARSHPLSPIGETTLGATPAGSIRRIGDGVLLVPVKASTWPEGFFESIRIDDANFTRPEQGELPPVVELTR